jgi:hypothetical protein
MFWLSIALVSMSFWAIVLFHAWIFWWCMLIGFFFTAFFGWAITKGDDL